ncbi:MAG: hypothetical protein QM640_05000 [Niabella sp.]
MQFQPESIYHIFNQGNNQSTIFHTTEDYSIFLTLIRQLIQPNSEILAWCLMPNHFHLLVYTTNKSCQKIQQGGLYIDLLTNSLRKLLSGYARIYNKKYIRTGSLFRQKTKSKALTDDNRKSDDRLSDYLYNCFSYIHYNPVEAGLVSTPIEWEYSSYKDYAGNRKDTLCNKELAAKVCGFSELDFR